MKKYLFPILLNALLAFMDVVLLIMWLITSKQELMYPLGFGTGLFISVLCVSLLSIVIRKKKSYQTQFDERQLKSRGTCFCVSFFFLLIFLFIDGIVRNLLDYEWSSYLVGVFTWGMLSIGVFAIMAIWKDAYTSEGENKLRFSIFLGVIGLIDCVVGIVLLMQDGFVINGQIGTAFINLLGGTVLLVTAINLFVKYKVDKRKVFMEDEEFETEVC
ncbi:MAG: hypothetical protein NC310_03005 [Roseburia sp.]|nr:hypothetical protein [Anaeroplasma bactoclasticum]MCM1196027.1 hypothetical protein [Roseburia sp.]MCM1557079.1 hypothetical protein [Anaeroplasma bactoclasticum]